MEAGVEKISDFNIVVGVAEKPLHGEDIILSLPEFRLFGVFDGLGGENAGDVASKTAAKAIEDFYRQRPVDQTTSIEEVADAKAALLAAEQAIQQRQQEDPRLRGMMTAASIIRLYIDKQTGTANLAYGHVGDCRIYLLRGDSLQQLTKDEGAGPFVDNCLGGLSLPPFPSDSIKQVGELSVMAGDRIMLCSDGITGDWGEEVLNNDEILAALDKKYDPQATAENLIRVSRKRDDKSVIVIYIVDLKLIDFGL